MQWNIENIVMIVIKHLEKKSNFSFKWLIKSWYAIKQKKSLIVRRGSMGNKNRFYMQVDM